MASPKGPNGPRLLYVSGPAIKGKSTLGPPTIFSKNGPKYLKGQERLFTGPLHAQKRDAIPA